MAVNVEPVTYTSSDGSSSIPSYLADPGGDGPRPAVLILYDGVPHGFAVRTHPGFRADAARQSFDEAGRFLATHLPGAARSESGR